jgi:hypothetical protein
VMTQPSQWSSLAELYLQTELACSVWWAYSVCQFHKDFKQQPTCVLTFTTLDFSISSNVQQNESGQMHSLAFSIPEHKFCKFLNMSHYT